MFLFFFFQAEDGIRDVAVTGVQTCALPIFTQRVAQKVVGARPCEVKILSETSLPVSQGFGVSAAAALSTALALDDALGAKIPRDELVAIAHETEVECGTGLGDVVPASMGGMDLRLEPRAPGHAAERQFRVEAGLLLAGF